LPGSGAGAGWTATTTVTVSDAAATTTSTSTPHPGGSSSLSSAQAVGVSIAAFGTLLLLVLIIWLCICCRRRKTRKQESKGEPSGATAEVRRRTWKPRMGVTQIRASLNIRPAPPAANDSEMHTAPWAAQRTPRGTSSKTGVEPIRSMRSMSSTNRPASRWSHKSVESNGSVAHLLPTKAVTAEEASREAVPPVAGVSRKSPKIPVSVHTPATVFEEDQSTFVPGLPANPAVGLRAAPVRPDRSQQPPLSLDIPKPLSKPVAKPIAMPWPAPPPPVHSSSSFAPPSFAYPAQSLQPQPKAAPVDVIYSAGPNNRQASRSPRMRSTTPDEGKTQTRRALPPALTISKVATRQRPVRHSSASDTSFESIGDDGPTPPEQEKHLTPVAEMSPISSVRYPRIPRSTNQVVPRSPAQGVPTHSPVAAGFGASRTYPTTPTTSTVGDRQAWSPNGTTLARSQGSWTKGDDVLIRTQAESPLHGLGMHMRSASPAMSQSSKLAPSLVRQGDDLYLGVKVGSPIQSQFARPARPNMI
jgi:hypothetical protein